jgi:hypothetical protein
MSSICFLVYVILKLIAAVSLKVSIYENGELQFRIIKKKHHFWYECDRID